MEERAQNTIRRVDLPDPSWPLAVESRRAILWIGAGIARSLPKDEAEALQALTALVVRPWSAVFVDAADLPLEQIKEANPELGGKPLRVYTTNPAVAPPPNRIPIYDLPTGTKSRPLQASEVLTRLQMLQRAPRGTDVFVVGLPKGGDPQSLEDARNISDAFARLVVVEHDESLAFKGIGFDSIVLWRASVQELLQLLDTGVGAAPDSADHLIRVRSGDSYKSINLTSSIDRSHPITAGFSLVPVQNTLDEEPATVSDLRAFLSDPASGWRAYAAGIPHPRHTDFLRDLAALATRFSKEGATLTQTAWIISDDGAGATTALRHLAFDLATAGWPVLVAHPHATNFDFHQLAGFLTRAAERFAAEGLASQELPWFIMFDAQHAQLDWDFITGVASGLKRLQRPAVVVAVKVASASRTDARRDALGANRFLSPPLRNTVSLDQAVALGEHLNKLLPPSLHRSKREWAQLLEDTLRSSPEGPRSLFWVALRFWLFRVEGTDRPFRHWLSAHIGSITAGRADMHATLLEIAALSRHRLALPSQLAVDTALMDLRHLASDSANVLGLIAVNRLVGTGFCFAHVLIGEEIIRIAAQEDTALRAVDKPTCVSPFDLELHLLDRVMTRDGVGGEEGVNLIEELVTAALRVDPRESPRNYAERDRIVSMLERVPDVVWDQSQILNHHAAKARRHIALDPPDQSWSVENLREQLELAEHHLMDALDNIAPDDESRREAPLNLQVSLALTFDARAKLEHRNGQVTEAAKFRVAADRAYLRAQRIDADNSYVLENLARFKLNQLSRFSEGEDRIRHIVDAIALLEWEWRVHQAQRGQTILEELANAYDLLEHGDGMAMLRELADHGSEAALVALSKLALRPGEQAEEDKESALAEAERRLRAVPAENATARSLFALYEIVSRVRPLAFPERLSLLERLEGDPDFAWPMQTRLEYGVLLFQAGGPSERRKGESTFRALRDDLAERSGALSLPPEMLFLADPKSDFKERLRTSIVIRKVADAGRNYFGIPNGWGAIEVPARVHEFGPNIRVGSERDCFIRFSNFGPRAVPTTILD